MYIYSPVPFCSQPSGCVTGVVTREEAGGGRRGSDASNAAPSVPPREVGGRLGRK